LPNHAGNRISWDSSSEIEVSVTETAYLICAITGGTLLACQLLVNLFGLGGHHDLGGHDSDADGHELHSGDSHDTHHAENLSSWFMSMLTFRTLAAALTFFGLTGMVGLSQWGESPTTLLVALTAGAAALFVVASLMRSFRKIKAEGTLRIERAVGKQGTVYLPIPGQKSGTGKVLLNLQNRTVECQAITAEQSLATGSPIVVVAVLGADTVEVAAAHPLGV
jgi:membrane protein implicated in regulation of membrane protease activity